MERRKPVDIAPVKSTRIYEEIVRQIKAMIAEGRLKSGDQLPPERDLAEKFLVSRTSVREALRALESVGLIEIRPGEGAFVREVAVEVRGGPGCARRCARAGAPGGSRSDRERGRSCGKCPSTRSWSRWRSCSSPSAR